MQQRRRRVNWYVMALVTLVFQFTIPVRNTENYSIPILLNVGRMPRCSTCALFEEQHFLPTLLQKTLKPVSAFFSLVATLIVNSLVWNKIQYQLYFR